MSTKQKTVLFFSPHPDDVEIFCGGTIAKLSSENVSVIIVDLTKGELSSRGSVEIREKESSHASSILKISERINLELPDGSLGLEHPDMPREQQIHKVTHIIKAVRPDCVFIPYGENRHPDHRNAPPLIKESLFKAGLSRLDSKNHHTVDVCFEYMMRLEFKPSIVIDITHFKDTKEKAMCAYESQLNRDMNHGNHATLVSDPLSKSSIFARDAYFGSMVGVEYGEPFLMRNPIGVAQASHFITSQSVYKSFIELTS